jgi:ATP-binding cassette subfamily F protein uup
MGILVSIERVTVVHGVAHVLDAVTVGVLSAQRIGVVGRNGGGKSTLLRVLAGRQEPDAGRVTQVGGLTVGLLAQDDRLDPGRDSAARPRRRSARTRVGG